MKKRLFKIAKPLAGILGFLILFSLLNKFIYGQQVKKRNRLKGKIQALDSQIKGIEKERRSWVKDLRKRQSYPITEADLFLSGDYSKLYSQLSGEGTVSRVKLLEMNLAKPEEDSLGKSYPFRLRMKGRYRDLLNHLEELEETLPLIRVKDMTIESTRKSSSALTMSLEGNINTLKPMKVEDHSPSPLKGGYPIKDPFVTWRKIPLRGKREESQGWKLCGIVQRQKGGNIALINSHLVAVGDKVQGRRVEKIEGDAVSLADSTEGLTVLKLKPQQFTRESEQ